VREVAATAAGMTRQTLRDWVMPLLSSKQRLQRVDTIVLSRLQRGFAPAVYASRAVLPPPHARLTSGWLASPCREGVEPSGSW
jgi:hypothetical protein